VEVGGRQKRKKIQPW